MRLLQYFPSFLNLFDRLLFFVSSNVSTYNLSELISAANQSLVKETKSYRFGTTQE